MISIKDACFILGITPTAIRKYEQCIADPPWYVGDNGYRGFFFENILYLLSARSLLRYGAPMSEAFCAQHVSDGNIRLDVLAASRTRLADEKQRIEALLESIDEEERLVNKIASLRGKYEIVYIPAFYYLELDGFSLSTEKKEIARSWVAAYPLTSFGLRYRIEDLQNGSCCREDAASMIFMVPESHSDNVVVDSLFVHRVPGKRVLATIIAKSGTTRSSATDTYAGALPFDEEAFDLIMRNFHEYTSREGVDLLSDVFIQLIDVQRRPGPDFSQSELEQSEFTYYFYAWTALA